MNRQDYIKFTDICVRCLKVCHRSERINDKYHLVDALTFSGTGRKICMDAGDVKKDE